MEKVLAPPPPGQRVTPGGAYWVQRKTLARSAERLRALSAANGRVTYLTLPQWAQILAPTLEFPPDLVIEFGRWRSSTSRRATGSPSNRRIGASMACGALLLAPRADNGLLAPFRDGEHLLAYPAGDVDGLLAALSRHASSPGTLAATAERGCEVVRDGHLARHRAGTVFDAMARVERHRRSDAIGAAYDALAAEAEPLARRQPASPLYRRLGAAYRGVRDVRRPAPAGESSRRSVTSDARP